MSDTEEHSGAARATISAISLKLPPFWPTDPDLWFAQVEAQFSTRSVTSEKTRYDYIVAALSPDIATEVRDLILTPPRDTPYSTLKRELIKRTAGSNQQKLQKLLNEVELGDSKPSHLLRRMRQLWTGTDDVLRELFFQKLPSSVRMVLAPSAPTTSLDKLAETADRVLEVSAPRVAAFHTPPASTEVESLRKQVQQLQEQLRAMSTRDSRRRSPTPARRRATSPARQTPVDHSLCWYHQRFGSAATKCRPPCSQESNTQAGH